MENLLMTVEDIMAITSISDNVDVQALRPFIQNATVMYLQPVLGISLLGDILLSVSTGGTKYELLLENYIYYALGYYTWYNYAPFGLYKFQKKGIVKQTSDDSQSVDLEELSLVMKRIEGMAVTYTNRLRDYLDDDNGVLYPLYRTNANDGVQDIKSNGSTIFLGFRNKR